MSTEDGEGNAEFEALIELLGTDDPDDEPEAGDMSLAPVANLRHADGRFDFSAIREFFGANPRSPQSVDGQLQPMSLQELLSQPAEATPEGNQIPHVSLPFPTPHFSPGRSFDQTFRSQTYLDSPTPARPLNKSTPTTRALSSPNQPGSSLVPAVTTFDPEADAAALKAISPLSLPPAEVSPSPSQEEGSSSPAQRPGSRPLSRALVKDEALSKSRPSTAPPDIFSGHKIPPDHEAETSTMTPSRPPHARGSSQNGPWPSLKLPFPEIHFTAGTGATPSPLKLSSTSPGPSKNKEETLESSVPPPPLPTSPLAPKSKGKSPETAVRASGAGGGTPIVVPMPGGPLDDRDTSTEASIQLPAPVHLPPAEDHRAIADEIRRGFEENRLQASILDSAVHDVLAHSSELAAEVAELQAVAAHLTGIDAPISAAVATVGDSTTRPEMDSGTSGVTDDGGGAVEGEGGVEVEPASFGTWTSLDDDEMLAHAGAMASATSDQHHHRPRADNTFTDIDPLEEDTQTATQLPRLPPLPATAADEHPEPNSSLRTSSATPRAESGAGNNSTSSPGLMDEIELMSGHEARRTLRALLSALGLLPSLDASDQPIHDQLFAGVIPPPTTAEPQPRSLDDVLRALDFVRSVDQLVWRGHRSAGGGVFGEKSVQALRDRIELWERAVRNPQVVPRVSGVASNFGGSGGGGGRVLQTGQLRTSFGPGPSSSRRERPPAREESDKYHRY